MTISKNNIPVEVSARHIHLCQKDLEKLFGKGYKLKKMKKLFQPGEFAAKETVEIKGKMKRSFNLRVLGPLRKETQVELSKTDAVYLRVLPIPIRDSGDLENTPGALLVGPKGKVNLQRGVINSWRHLHCNPQEAQKIGLKDRDLISMKVNGLGAVTFHNVKVRVEEDSLLCLHLDTDEGNAANIKERGKGEIVSCL